MRGSRQSQKQPRCTKCGQFMHKHDAHKYCRRCRGSYSDGSEVICAEFVSWHKADRQMLYKNIHGKEEKGIVQTQSVNRNFQFAFPKPKTRIQPRCTKCQQFMHKHDYHSNCRRCRGSYCDGIRVTCAECITWLKEDREMLYQNVHGKEGKVMVQTQAVNSNLQSAFAQSKARVQPRCTACKQFMHKHDYHSNCRRCRGSYCDGIRVTCPECITWLKQDREMLYQNIHGKEGKVMVQTQEVNSNLQPSFAQSKSKVQPRCTTCKQFMHKHDYHTNCRRCRGSYCDGILVTCAECITWPKDDQEMLYQNIHDKEFKSVDQKKISDQFPHLASFKSSSNFPPSQSKQCKPASCKNCSYLLKHIGSLRIISWNVKSWTPTNSSLRKQILDILKPDIIYIIETWLKDSAVIEYKGYQWYGHNRQNLAPTAIRGSGGVGVFLKDSLLDEWDFQILDKSVDGLFIGELIHKRKSFKIMLNPCYLPPVNTPWGCNSSLFFDHLQSKLLEAMEDTNIYVGGGDFNARLGNMQEFVEERKIVDHSNNTHGKSFLSFLTACKLGVLNGRMNGEDNFTYFGTKGNSVIDYFITRHHTFHNFKHLYVKKVSNLIKSAKIAPSCSIPDHSVLITDLDLSEFDISIIEQALNEKPRCMKCKELMHKYDHHNYCQRCRSSKCDGFAVTCTECVTWPEIAREQLYRNIHYKIGKAGRIQRQTGDQYGVSADSISRDMTTRSEHQENFDNYSVPCIPSLASSYSAEYKDQEKLHCHGLPASCAEDAEDAMWPNSTREEIYHNIHGKQGNERIQEKREDLNRDNLFTNSGSIPSMFDQQETHNNHTISNLGLDVDSEYRNQEKLNLHNSGTAHNEIQPMLLKCDQGINKSHPCSPTCDNFHNDEITATRTDDELMEANRTLLHQNSNNKITSASIRKRAVHHDNKSTISSTSETSQEMMERRRKFLGFSEQICTFTIICICTSVFVFSIFLFVYGKKAVV